MLSNQHQKLMSKKHARLSPSSAHRWTSCTASAAAQDGYVNENSDASRQGTTCHQIQEELLLNPELDPYAYVGRKLVFTNGYGEFWMDEIVETEIINSTEAIVEVTLAMVDAVMAAVHFIREQHELLGGELLVEQRVPIGQFTGEEDAGGTSDVTIIGDTWIHVMDSKFGRARVDASDVVQRGGVDFITGAKVLEKRGPNLQMASYALGSVHKHDVFGEIRKITMTIVQPFITHTDSYSCSIEELREVEEFLRTKAEETRTNPVFAPSKDNCHFCLHKNDCKARTELALTTVFSLAEGSTVGTVNLPCELTLGSQYALVPFVEAWAKDIAAATQKALANGQPVVRNDGLAYKLVNGRLGDRKWKNDEEAARNLIQARLTKEEMYVFKLISPAMAESLSKAPRVPKGTPKKPARLPPTAWNALQDLIVRDDGKPQIVLDTDPRPARNKAEGFGEVVTPEEELAALFGE